MNHRRRCRGAPQVLTTAFGLALAFVSPAISQTPDSPRLARLQQDAAKDTEAEGRFWREIEHSGVPLVEGAEEGYLTTFLWRGTQQTTSVIVMSSLTFADEPRDLMMERLPGTGVWYRTYRFAAGTAVLYQLSPDESSSASDGEPPADFASRLQKDPLNERFMSGKMGGSYIVLPGSNGHAWSHEAVGQVPVENLHIQSVILDEERALKVFVPEAARDVECLSLLVLFDADLAIEKMRVPVILERLSAADELPPTAAVFVVQNERAIELLGNEEFARFVAQEVVPWMQSRYPVCRDRTRTTIGGVSAGGLAAALTALRHPDTFGGALIISGSLRWAPQDDLEREWMARQWSTSQRRDVRLALWVGRHETVVPPGENQISLVVAHHHLRDVLRARGADVRLVLYEGAHEPLSWRGALPDALRWLSVPSN